MKTQNQKSVKPETQSCQMDVSGSTLRKLTISGIFNDYFTNYEDKEISVLMTVDVVKDCTCGEKRCLIHEMPSNYVLSKLL
jgi:hypothetical protein